jgi:hypothetical protein
MQPGDLLYLGEQSALLRSIGTTIAPLHLA